MKAPRTAALNSAEDTPERRRKIELHRQGAMLSMMAERDTLSASNQRLRQALYAAGWQLDCGPTDECPSTELKGMNAGEQLAWVQAKVRAALGDK